MTAVQLDKTLTPELENLVVAIRDDLIGGAADMARETARSLYGLATDKSVPDSEFPARLDSAIHAIVQVTPSIMPVTRVLHSLVSAAEAAPGSEREAVAAAGLDFITWLDASLDRIAQIGGDLIRDGDRLFLFSMSSTVYRMIEAALGIGRRVTVVTTISLPGGEGVTTLRRLCPQGVSVDIGPDAALVELMRDCTAAYVGSDNVTSTGDCLAKVGCFPTALAAAHFGIPFYVAGDTSKFDPSSKWGVPIKIREMAATDIVSGEIPERGRIRNPAFEVVPASLITAYVTERGLLHPGAVFEMMSQVPWNDRVGETVAAHNRGA